MADELLLPTGEDADAAVGKRLRADGGKLRLDVFWFCTFPHRKFDQVTTANGEVFGEHVLLRDKPDAAVHFRRAVREAAGSHERA